MLAIFAMKRDHHGQRRPIVHVPGARDHLGNTGREKSTGDSEQSFPVIHQTVLRPAGGEHHEACSADAGIKELSERQRLQSAGGAGE
jgi:hypothetical protein